MSCATAVDGHDFKGNHVKYVRFVLLAEQKQKHISFSFKEK